MHLLLVCREFSDGAFGRAYCLWLLAKAAGYSVSVVTTLPGEPWVPLRAETGFLNDCRVITSSEVQALHAEVEAADLIIAVKPLPSSLGVAWPLAKSCGKPLLVDIDDPDLEARWDYLRWRSRVRAARTHPLEQVRLRRMRRLVRHLPVMVSNPTLQQRYGGVVIPHVRPAGSPGPKHTSTCPTVAFVGSPGLHKGPAVLRAAVASLAGSGFRLVVTADPPPDAEEHEEWTGPTDLARGQALVRQADIVALPSLRTNWGPGQLPVKLVDAMLASRAIVVSDLDPLVWAAGECALVVECGSTEQLTNALRQLSDPVVREELGAAARRRALSMFTIEAVLPYFKEAAERARISFGQVTP